MVAERERCDAVTARRGRPTTCRRAATWSTLTRDGRTVRECSRHHARDAGVWRLLAPHPWDVVSEVELGHTVLGRAYDDRHGLGARDVVEPDDWSDTVLGHAYPDEGRPNGLGRKA